MGNCIQQKNIKNDDEGNNLPSTPLMNTLNVQTVHIAHVIVISGFTYHLCFCRVPNFDGLTNTKIIQYTATKKISLNFCESVYKMSFSIYNFEGTYVFIKIDELHLNNIQQK